MHKINAKDIELTTTVRFLIAGHRYVILMKIPVVIELICLLDLGAEPNALSICILLLCLTRLILLDHPDWWKLSEYLQ